MIKGHVYVELGLDRSCVDKDRKIALYAFLEVLACSDSVNG